MQNEITDEDIKFVGENLIHKIYELALAVWYKEIMPRSWRKTVIIPILKSRD